MIDRRHASYRLLLAAGAAALALATTGCGWLFKSNHQQQQGNRFPNGSGNSSLPLPPLPMPTMAAPGDGRVQLQSGQYEFRVRNDLVGANGFPPEVIEQLRQRLAASSTTVQNCISPTDAASPDYGLNRGLLTAGCQPGGLQINGGRLSGVMACNFQGIPAQGQINGRVTSDSIFMQLTIAAQAPDGRSVAVRTEVNANRTGACGAGGGFPAPGGGGAFPQPAPMPQPYPQSGGGK